MNEWTIRYLKNDKRTACIFPAENIADALKKWTEHTKGLIETKNIFSMVNNTVLMSCDKCIKYPMRPNIQGDGFCEKHDYRFSMWDVKNPCPMCANEEGLCISCGEKISNMEKKLI